MGTIISFPGKPAFTASLMPIDSIESLKASRTAQLLQIAAAGRVCSTLNESADVLRRSLGQLYWLVEMIEDNEMREELRTTLKSASATLEDSLSRLDDARQVMKMT